MGRMAHVVAQSEMPEDDFSGPEYEYCFQQCRVQCLFQLELAKS